MRSKKLLSIIMVLAMLMSTVAFGAMNDVKGHWAQGPIDKWATVDVLNGYPDGSFKPNNGLTRAELAQVMVNLLGFTEKAHMEDFTDVEEGAWYVPAIERAVAAGILQGFGNGLVMPNGPVDRQTAIVMIGRALGIEGEEKLEKSFEDSDKIAVWAQPMVYAMVNKGFVHGISESEVAPLIPINRASIAQLLANMVSNYITTPGEHKANGGIIIVASDNVVITGEADAIVIAPKANGAKNITLKDVKAGTLRVAANDADIKLVNSEIAKLQAPGKNSKIHLDKDSKIENQDPTLGEGTEVKKDGEVVPPVGPVGPGGPVVPPSVAVTGIESINTTNTVEEGEVTYLFEGDTSYLTAVVLPLNATNKTVTWEIKSQEPNDPDTEVATLSGNKLSAEAEGTVTVKATSQNNPNATKELVITVKPALGDNAVAVTGGEGYETLQAAIEAAEDSGTVTLLEDVTPDSTVKITKPLTLDGNNRSVSVTTDATTTEGYAILVEASGVTIKNITLNSKNNWALQVYNSQDITLENITAKSEAKGAIIINASTATVKGNIDVSGVWGGIEVSKGTAENLNAANLEIDPNANLVNNGQYSLIWIDKVSKVVEVNGQNQTQLLDEDEMPGKVADWDKAGLAESVVVHTSGRLQLHYNLKAEDITIQEAIQGAINFDYSTTGAPYTYNGSFSMVDGKVKYTFKDGFIENEADLIEVMNDLARYLGALYRQPGSTVEKITYGEEDYTWVINGVEYLKGSNWRNGEKTLISKIATDFSTANPTITELKFKLNENVDLTIDYSVSTTTP